MARTYRRGRIYQGCKKVPDKDCHRAGNLETTIAGDRVVALPCATFPASRWAKRRTSKQRRRADHGAIRRELAR